jgi:hypothetical protein
MKTKRLSANYMDIIFSRNESRAWRQKDNGIVEIEVENKGFFNAIAQKFFKRPKKSQISLDKYGSKIWLLFDGHNAVSDIVKTMEEDFSSEKDRMLDRVITFLGILEVHKFIIRK